MGRIAEKTSDFAPDDKTLQMAQAVKSARSRVVFRAPKGDEAPEAILVADPDYERLPVARPYQLRD